MVPYWHFSHWAITVIARKALFARRRNLIERVIRLLHPYGVRNDKITVLYGQATSTFDRAKPVTFRPSCFSMVSRPCNAVETFGQNLSLGALRAGYALGDRQER